MTKRLGRVDAQSLGMLITDSKPRSLIAVDGDVNKDTSWTQKAVSCTQRRRKMINTGLQIGRRVAGALWKFAKSDNALAIIKVAATFAAFVHSVDELRKANRPVGFRR